VNAERCSHYMSLTLPCLEEAIATREVLNRKGDETKILLCARHAELEAYMAARGSEMVNA